MEKIKSRRKIKLKPIARKRRNYIYLLLAILLAIATGYIFINFPPDYNFQFSKIKIPILPIFFASLAAFIFSTVTFLFLRKKQGILFTTFILTYLGIRMVDLTHWIFLLLFLALFITVELFILKKK